MSLNQLVWHNIINVIPRVTIQSLIQSTLIYKVTNKSSGTAQDKYCVQDTHVDVPEVQKQNKKQSEIDRHLLISRDFLDQFSSYGAVHKLR